MVEERKKILNHINEIIEKRRIELLQKIPDIHKIGDGFIFRFFTDWDDCNYNTQIKYKKISNLSKPEETVLLFYIPKGTYLEHIKREYVGDITCISGCLELNMNDRIIFIEAFTKVCLETNEFHGRALENCYLITTNTV